MTNVNVKDSTPGDEKITISQLTVSAILAAVYSFLFLFVLVIGFENAIDIFEEFFETQGYLAYLVPAIFALIYATIMVIISLQWTHREFSFALFNLGALITLVTCVILGLTVEVFSASSTITLIATFTFTTGSVLVGICIGYIPKILSRRK